MELLRSNRVVDISEPILAEDSTFSVIALSLQAIYEQLGEEAIHHDYLVGLLLVLLHECGFRTLPISVPRDETESDKRIIWNQSLCKTKNSRLVYLPADWKSEKGYYIRLQYTGTLAVAKLIIMPVGDKLILNMYTNIGDIYSMVIKTLFYVNPYSSGLPGRYRNLKQISYSFKDGIVNPMRMDILFYYGGRIPCLLGLPVEIQMKIAKMMCICEARCIWNNITPSHPTYHHELCRLGFKDKWKKEYEGKMFKEFYGLV